jgi:hypothetical protein
MCFNKRALTGEDNLLLKYLKCDRHEVLQCALILGSAIENFESVAIATVINFAMSISNSGVQCRTVIDFHFRFLGISQEGYFFLKIMILSL